MAIFGDDSGDSWALLSAVLNPSKDWMSGYSSIRGQMAAKKRQKYLDDMEEVKRNYDINEEAKKRLKEQEDVDRQSTALMSLADTIGGNEINSARVQAGLPADQGYMPALLQSNPELLGESPAVAAATAAAQSRDPASMRSFWQNSVPKMFAQEKPPKTTEKYVTLDGIPLVNPDGRHYYLPNGEVYDGPVTTPQALAAKSGRDITISQKESQFSKSKLNDFQLKVPKLFKETGEVAKKYHELLTQLDGLLKDPSAYNRTNIDTVMAAFNPTSVRAQAEINRLGGSPDLVTRAQSALSKWLLGDASDADIKLINRFRNTMAQVTDELMKRPKASIRLMAESLPLLKEDKEEAIKYVEEYSNMYPDTYTLPSQVTTDLPRKPLPPISPDTSQRLRQPKTIDLSDYPGK